MSGSAPVPYAPETSTAPHSTPTVPPLAERAASPEAKDDNPLEAERLRQDDSQRLGHRDSSASTATLPVSVGGATAVSGEDEKRDLEKGVEEEVVVIDWDVDDPECPLNWPKGRKMVATVTVAMFTLLA
jgi:hypothetical protein